MSARFAAARSLVVMALTALLCAPAAAVETGNFRFAREAGPALQVYYARAEADAGAQRVLFVLHGLRRNAREYRNHWRALALRHNLLVLAPRFDERHFPRAAGYNLGNIYSPRGRARPREAWSFAVIEPLFDAAQERFGLQQRDYFLFGHSAGAQFVHRYLLFMQNARVRAAVAANAGWYTVPDPRVAWPYGVRDAQFSRAALSRALAHKLVVLLGCDDNDPAARNLRVTREARAQGAHRLARGLHFVAFGEALARASGVTLGWRAATVAGVGHDASKMAPAAAAALFDEEPLRDVCPAS